ncbi:1-aminocyclopropane-1-carboxylate deaminase/D-cysteine desulfhydrase [Microbulbifer sp. THAF38]|uniref:1-aminocyclopropane-1-carboxylate deaminase/D-cysteine desulfhydrase n=1 Tax=Microbulbifer sp. THAF38 TaxID=2587856 RepID=UPI0012684FD6|nr:pyridoxal-phosphate dependent enzyme [Microbulbifer sp. THAF38]QFT54603.1 D-cysteine desulfhydrase [Microbulbifer sp. THAF38]
MSSIPHYLTNLDLNYFTEAARDIPYQKVHSDLFPGVEVWIRRDDLLDPLISGNKAYKLLYNLIDAGEQGVETLITCGGAWSNHLHASAAAGARFGYRTIGIIRGERPPELSAMLQDAERLGMGFKFVTRELYRQRNQQEFPGHLGGELQNYLYLPEGGANFAGARGVFLLGKIIEATKPIRFDQLWVACGTGLTLGGLRAAVNSFPVCGVEVLKAGGSIRRDAQRWLAALSTSEACRRDQVVAKSVDLMSEYHCDGYGKYPSQLQAFQQAFERQSSIPLDPIYTAKLLYAIHLRANAGHFECGTKILALHSGGLQGRRGLQLGS